jgi:hypothetical protein
MNKLEERLHKVFMNEEVGGDVFVSLAKEAKELAIEFAEWVTINYFARIDLIKQEVISYREKTTRTTFKKTTEELFNKFIEEKYGK